MFNLFRKTFVATSNLLRLNQWSLIFFVQSPPNRNFASKLPPTYDFRVGKYVILIRKFPC